ncbi:MAG: SLC26A/SulP transporter family protein [Chloroflexota bacterium]|nr:MAG: SLC26A/SulP transporter family protein [Chloroflexota bacterium]
MALKPFLNNLLQKATSLRLFSNLRGDFFGGITASIVALPLAIAFGVAAFVPLGPDYVAQGALAGLYAFIIAGFLASIFGGTPAQITGPTAPMAVVITAFIARFARDPELADLGVSTAEAILLMVAATILLAGIFQIVLGAVGGGRLIKYIPFPVVSGIMNGIAVLIFLSQIRPFFGVGESVSSSSLFTGQAGFNSITVAIGVVTIIATVYAGRLIRVIPAALIGVGAGIATYFLIGFVASPDLLQPQNNPLIVGSIPSALPTPDKALSFINFAAEIPLAKWVYIIIPALTLSILASLDTLLTSVVVDMTTKSKHNSKRELIGQGIGNLGSAVFGGLPAAGTTSVAMVSINNGGRTRLAGVITSVSLLLVVLVLSPAVKWIPLSALAGILMVTAVKMVDYKSLILFGKKSTLENMIIVLAVTVSMVIFDLVIAVGIGLVIACLLFVREQINKTIIRRKYSGELIHSKKVRTQEAMHTLEEHGHQIKVYELSDALFFGTCDKLLTEIEKDYDSKFIILDLKRVNTVDLTGTQLLRQIADSVKDKGHHLLMAYVDMPGDRNKERLRSYLEDVGVTDVIGRDHIFPATDDALEWAEDLLVKEEMRGAQRETQILELHDISVFQGLSPEQLHLVQHYVRPVSFRRGDIIFREGDVGDGIYFILSGYVSVFTGSRDYRLATFADGVFFGEMSILEDKPRSATVRAETDTKLLFMSKEDFQQLTQTEPALAAHILRRLSSDLSHRLRMTNAEVRALEE